MSWGLLALAQKLQGLKTISQGDNYMHNCIIMVLHIESAHFSLDVHNSLLSVY